MKTAFLFVALFAFSSWCFAQKIKVQKVKGNQAIVEFSGGTLQSGQVYELTSEDFSESAPSPSRKYLVNLDMSLFNTKSDAVGAKSETSYVFSGKLGWNLGSIEVGPSAAYSHSSGSVTMSNFSVGGFADYNLIANTPGEIFIYGVGGTSSFGQLDADGRTMDILYASVGPFVKWFPTGGSNGFRVDAGYSYQKTSGGTTGDTTTTGLGITVGVSSYF